ncbi:MAG: alpha/beta hydrolase [Acidobacteriota bacterium]
MADRKSRFRRWLRTLLIIVAVLAIVYPLSFFLRRSWIVHQLASSSRLANTPRGPVEYLEGGRGPATLLILHGTPGGYDEGLLLAQWIRAERSFRFIAPSRPGYLRTPVEVGSSPAEAAAAMIALLDTLGATRSSVLAWSGAGPTALELAGRYPQRISALVLLSTRVRGDDKYRFADPSDRGTPIAAESLRPDTGIFGPDAKGYLGAVMFRLLPNRFFERYFPAETRSMGLAVERLRQLRTVTSPPSRRYPGKANDQWQFASLDPEPRMDVRVPTLIVHSPGDEAVDISHAYWARDQIPGAELLEVESESHFTTLNPASTRIVMEFLQAHAEGDPVLPNRPQPARPDLGGPQ